MHEEDAEWWLWVLGMCKEGGMQVLVVAVGDTHDLMADVI